MKNKWIFLTVLAALLSLESFAQNKKLSIRGTLIDSTNTALVGATVILLNATDSVLHSFALSDHTGAFEIKKLTAAEYILQVTYVGYGNFSEGIALHDESLDLGPITLLPESELLEEVVVKAEHIPIRIKNDTIEYNSAAYKTQPHAVVEDLLKKLPGVEIARDGSIRAQGERVDKVLVDGKEFFGDDPKIATKNLPADAVDKVQVFDKKSEMAEFTGIEDGRESKTINLSLKEDKKNGYFGNAEMGYGSENRFEGKANVNRFGQRSQFSAIAMANNTNQEGFSIEDYINFMGGLQNLMSGSGGGGMRLTLNSDELGLPMNLAPNNGLRRTLAGGLNFNYEFGKKTELQSSYFYNHLKNEAEQTVARQNFVDDQFFNSFEESQGLTLSSGHRLNLKIKHEIDSFQNLIFRLNGGWNTGMQENLFNSQTNNVNDQPENIGLRDNRGEQERINATSSLIYRRRFKRRGRALVGELKLDGSQQLTEANIYSSNTFAIDEPNTSFSDTLQQFQRLESNPWSYEMRLSYTEPLGKRRYLEFSYAHRNFANDAQKRFYDIFSSKENERQFNPALSNHYRMDYDYDLGGMKFVLNRKKYNFAAGLGWQRSALRGDILSETIELNRDFNFWLPNLRWNYDFTSTRNITLQYTTQVQEPTLEQLQPVVDNSNPLNIYIGNEKLRPEYTHQLSLNFMSFDPFSSISVMAMMDGAYTKNKITNSQTIDLLFRRRVQPVNVKDDFRLNTYLSFSSPVKLIKSQFNLVWNSNYNRGILLVNTIENVSKRWNHSVELSFQNSKTEVVDLYLGAQLGYSQVHYSVDDQLDQRYLNQIYFADLTLNFAKHWALNTTLDYTRYSGEAFADSRAIPIFGAALSRNILGQRGQIKFTIIDLLNKNIGIRRNNDLNYIEEVNTKTLGRYALLKFVYALSGLNSGGLAGDLHIRRR